MVDIVYPGASSFAPLIEYLLHDPPLDPGAPQPRTAERVAFMDVRNLPACAVEDIAGIMETTVRDAGELKALAGVGPQGAKLWKPVHHYVLSWHRDEDPDQAEVRQAVAESLTAQGLQDHQTVYAVHIDTESIHVHVVTNGVHSDTGLAADVWRTGKKLSRWARQWEERHGGVRCHRRPTEEERQAWDNLILEQRTSKTDPATARLERNALAREIDTRRKARGEPPAARPGRSAARYWRRRDLAYSKEERGQWNELYMRHRREDTPEDVRRKDRAVLVERIRKSHCAIQEGICERAVSVDIDVKVLIDTRDAPHEAGQPRTMARWNYVEKKILPVVEANVREIIGARLKGRMGNNFFYKTFLSDRPAYENGYTEPHSLERYRECDERLVWRPSNAYYARQASRKGDAGRRDGMHIDFPARRKAHIERCQEIAARANVAGVPDVNSYAKAERPRGQIWAESRVATSSGCNSVSHARLTDEAWATERLPCCQMEVYRAPRGSTRWEAVWLVWNSAPRRGSGPQDTMPAMDSYNASATPFVWVATAQSIIDASWRAGCTSPARPT